MTGKFRLPMLLDGATGTNLMRAGMPQGVCAEQWIIGHPDPLRQLQRAYARAGSDAVMAPTFEANRHRLAAFGLEGQVAEINRRLCEISRQAVGNGVLVAGDMSPLGEFVEPFGDMTFAQLTDIFREQAFALKNAGADYIAVETMTSLTEARASLLAAKETGLPVTVTLTVDEKGRLLSGGDPTACLVVLAAMGADAVGLNCSTGPDIVLRCLAAAAPYVHVPLIAKPNAGLPVQGKTGVYDITPEAFAAYVPRFLEAGAAIIGGCCGTTPETVAHLRREIDRHPFVPRSGDDGTGSEGARDFLAADERHTWRIDADSIDFSHKLDCAPDLADRLIQLSEENFVAARIRVGSVEDAHELGMCAYLCTLPVVLLSGDAAALEEALRLYQGRALIDSKSDLPADGLRTLAERYGAVVI